MVSIEDSFDQDDWPAWGKMNAEMNVQLVGLVLVFFNANNIYSLLLVFKQLHEAIPSLNELTDKPL